MAVLLMATEWTLVFVEVKDVVGFPLSEHRLRKKLNYNKNLILNKPDDKYEEDKNNKNLDKNLKNKRHERRVNTSVKEFPAEKSQEGDHAELYTRWSQLHEPNTSRRWTTRTTSSTRTCPISTTRTEVPEEFEAPKNDHDEDYMYRKKIMEVLRNSIPTQSMSRRFCLTSFWSL